MARYNGQQQYNNIGGGIQLSPIYAIGKPNNFLELAEKTVNKLETAREKVSQEEKILNDTFRIYQTKLDKEDMPYFNKKTEEVRRKIHENPFDISAAMQLGAEFGSDKELIARMKYTEEDREYRKKINELPGAGPITKMYWNAKRPRKFTPHYENGNFVSADEYQYRDQTPLEDLDWEVESRKVFSLVNPNTYNTRSGTGGHTDTEQADGTYRRTGGKSEGWTNTTTLTEDNLRKALAIWYDDGKHRAQVAQEWDRDHWYADYLRDKIYNDKELSQDDKDKLEQELKELERMFSVTNADNLKDYAFHKITTGSYASVFKYTNVDKGKESSHDNLISGESGGNGSKQSLEDLLNQLKEQDKYEDKEHTPAESISYPGMISYGVSGVAEDIKSKY